MGFFSIKIASKILSLIATAVLSIFSYQPDDIYLEVKNDIKNINVVATEKNFKIEKQYDSSIPSNIKKTINKGSVGVTYYNNDGKLLYTEEPKNEQLLVGTGKYGIYNGVITGYGPDCSTCLGDGYVTCKTADKKNFSLVKDGIYYKDSEFGEVRILAAALSMFPCGTIIEVQTAKLGNIMGIVMDTGYDMKKQLEDGVYHIDIAYKTEKDEMISNTTDKTGKTVFNVQRWGW